MKIRTLLSLITGLTILGLFFYPMYKGSRMHKAEVKGIIIKKFRLIDHNVPVFLVRDLISGQDLEVSVLKNVGLYDLATIGDFFYKTAMSDDIALKYKINRKVDTFYSYH